MSIENDQEDEEGRLTTGPEEGTYYAYHDASMGDLSTTLVLTIAEVADVSPTDFRLYDYVDPEALNALFRPLDDGRTPEGWVKLRVLEHDVTVYSSGRIEIRP